jgi:hypothetical protein
MTPTIASALLVCAAIALDMPTAALLACFACGWCGALWYAAKLREAGK